MDLNVSRSQIRDELRKRWTTQAVELALMGHWDEAVQGNLQILELFPDDIQARNRLGKAYSELGRYEEAAEAYEQNLERQPSNAIARKKLTDLYALLKREPEAALESEADSEDEDDEDDEEFEHYAEEEEPEAELPENEGE
jgi:tetratricopeptide (TPR) repeat protein